jgi:sterol desaturase/sphingolipid hydroxylase (fatty acid hydroxylase superfamily)
VTTLLHVLVWNRLLPTAALLFWGIVAEVVAARYFVVSEPSNRLGNVWYSICFLVFDVTIGGFFMVYVVMAIPGPKLFTARPSVLCSIAIFLLASILGDFCTYWIHRLEHRSNILWPIHELHHADECMNVTTTYRVNVLESFTIGAAVILPAMLIPNPIVIIPALYGALRAHAFFAHLNAPIGLGPLTKIIASPLTHRIHHSKLPHHLNHNFAVVWTFWDVAFGTYYHPQPGEYPPTGIQ